MSFEEEFAADSINILKSVLLPQGAKLTDKIDELNRESEEHVAYYGYIKDFPVSSGAFATIYWRRPKMMPSCSQ